MAVRSSPSLAEGVALCRHHTDLLARLGEIYERADEQVRGTGAQCLGGGACCRFDHARHRLYAATGELAMLTVEPPPRRPVRSGRCPYQLGPRCMARPRRPLGCRTFFCDPAVQQVCQTVYESLHREIRSLHETRSVPYFYVELTAGLAAAWCPPAAP